MNSPTPTPSVKEEKTISDVEPFVHGQEGTHGACQEELDKLGSNTPCCECSGHQCRPPLPQDLEELLRELNQYYCDSKGAIVKELVSRTVVEEYIKSAFLAGQESERERVKSIRILKFREKI